VGDDLRRLATLTLLEVHAYRGAVTVLPGCLDEDVATDQRPIGLGERDLLDLFVEIVAAAELVVHEREVLPEDPAILRGQESSTQELLEPTAVFAGPVGAFPEDEAPSGEELRYVMPRAQDLTLEGLAAAHQVADSLLRRRGDPNRD